MTLFWVLLVVFLIVSNIRLRQKLRIYETIAKLAIKGETEEPVEPQPLRRVK